MQSDARAASEASSPRGSGSVLGARAKSVSAPSQRAPSSPGRPSPASDERGSPVRHAVAPRGAPQTSLAEYRAWLIELYSVHNPANVARVDYLLAKYRGQEEFLYRSVYSKYRKAGDTYQGSLATGASLAPSAARAPSPQPAPASFSSVPATEGKLSPAAVECPTAAESPCAESTSVGQAASTAAAASAQVFPASTTVATRPKAVLPRPPVKALFGPSAGPSRTSSSPVASRTNGEAAELNDASTSCPASPDAPAVVSAEDGRGGDGDGGPRAARKPGSLLAPTNGALAAVPLQADPRLGLLAKIDFVLLGERSGFFERPLADISSGSDHSSDSSSESASMSRDSSSTGDDGLPDASPVPVGPAASPPPAVQHSESRASRPMEALASPLPVVAPERRSKPERTVAPAAAAPAAAAPATTAPATTAHAAAASSGPEGPAAGARVEAAAPAQAAVAKEAAPVARAPAPMEEAPKPLPAPPPTDDPVVDDDDSDINDEMIAAALGAKLSTVEEVPPPSSAPVPEQVPTPSAAAVPATDKLKDARDSEAPGHTLTQSAVNSKHEPAATEAADPEADEAAASQARGGRGPHGYEASGHALTQPVARSRREPLATRAVGLEVPEAAASPPDSVKPFAVKAKAWGVPPPLRGARGFGARSRVPDNDTGAKPKKPPTVIPEAPAPPLFDQWLACLKFVTGWNDQCSHTASEVKKALREHLTEEGIENSRTVDRLCSTVVPLLLDLRRIDGAVVKNLKTEVLRGLKIVQVSILRIVTFELCRERDAKAAMKKREAFGAGGADDMKAGGPHAVGNGATYLASDISSLAKVVQHFRFDRTFSEGLHQLILSIRRQKRVIRSGTPGVRRHAMGPAEAAAAAARKRRLTCVGASGASSGPEPGGTSAPSTAPTVQKRPRMVS